MKCGEVNRHLGAHRFQNPIAHAAQIILIIVGIGNNQIGQFDPAIGLTANKLNRVQYRLQM